MNRLTDLLENDVILFDVRKIALTTTRGNYGKYEHRVSTKGRVYHVYGMVLGELRKENEEALKENPDKTMVKNTFNIWGLIFFGKLIYSKVYNKLSLI